jgi:alpha-L-fucosidase
LTSAQLKTQSPAAAAVQRPLTGPDWLRHARYGLFIHWGLYSTLGRGEWARNREQVPDHAYRALSDEFTASQYSPRDWARTAAESGMRYAVLTAKHHEGFCLWNSRTCSFNSANSGAARDIVQEFVEAFRQEGLKVGLYYSLGDWENPDWARAVKGDQEAEARFVDYTHALVDELMTGYGPIDVLWYDLPQGLTADQWRAKELNQLVRQRQPGILINNRSMLAEDFSIFEQHVQAAPEGRMWEACMTLNESWGFVGGDKEFKTPRKVASILARVSMLGGSLLLNVGPNGEGALPQESVRILREVGEWLDRCGESVYATRDKVLPFNLFGSTVAHGNHLYLFLERYFGETVTLGGLEPDVVCAEVLGTGQRLKAHREGGQTHLTGLPPEPPDPLLTVIKMELTSPAEQSISRAIGGADIMADFPH